MQNNIVSIVCWSGQGGVDRLIQDIMTLSTVVGGYVKIFKPVSLKWTNWYKGWYAKRIYLSQVSEYASNLRVY